MAHETGIQRLASYVQRVEAGYQTSVDLTVQRVQSEPAQLARYAELNTDMMHISGYGRAMYEVKALPEDLLKLSVISATESNAPHVSLSQIGDMEFYVNVDGGSDSSTENSIQLHITPNGVEHVIKNGHVMPIICVATEADKSHPWYHKHNAVRKKAGYVVMLGGITALLGPKKQMPPHPFSSDVVEFVRAPWIRKEIEFPNILRSFTSLTTLYQLHDAYQFPPPMRTYAYTRSDGFRFVSIELDGYMRNMDSVHDTLTLGQKFTKFATKIYPDIDRFSLSVGQLNGYETIADEYECMGPEDLDHIQISAEGISYVRANESIPGSLVVLHGLSAQIGDQARQAFVMHDTQLHAQLHRKIA